MISRKRGGQWYIYFEITCFLVVQVLLFLVAMDVTKLGFFRFFKIYFS